MRFYFFLAFMLVSVQSFASSEFYKVSNDWGYWVHIDDFNDKKSCSIATTKKVGSTPNITIWVSREQSKTMVRIMGAGIKYRVDKEDPVDRKYKYPLVVGNNSMLIRDSEIVNHMISSFKKGNTLVYKLYTSKKHTHKENYKTTLKGFTLAYNKALKCE